MKEAKTAPARPDEAKKEEPVSAAAKTNHQETIQQNEMAATVKEIENAIYAIKFYPVAVTEPSKKEAAARLRDMYSKGNETARQLLLYMIHDVLATSADLKAMHTYEYFKMKNPGNQDPAQLRIQVYRAMFNYNTSLEGLIEVVRILGSFSGSDDAAKLLTYHFSHLSSMESEANHMLRSAILEALGASESHYALRALLEYARYTDSERTFSRVVGALLKWEEKLDSMKISDSEKDQIKKELRKIVTSDFGGSHYG
ncbi:MAG: hypothetical protein U0R44_03345 [Candidatus Micrarchaeia archaeon]